MSDTQWITADLPDHISIPVDSATRPSAETGDSASGAQPQRAARMAERTARVPLGAWLGVARAAGQFDNVERLPDLSVPTLVLYASQDGVASSAAQWSSARRSTLRRVAAG